MRPEVCIVCGQDTPEPAHKAAWGPITLFFHTECAMDYRDAVAPRLKFSLLNAIRRWSKSRGRILGPQRSTTDREP